MSTVKVYPKAEQLETVVENLKITVNNLNVFSDSLHSDYKKESIAFYVDCIEDQIKILESLYESDS